MVQLTSPLTLLNPFHYSPCVTFIHIHTSVLKKSNSGMAFKSHSKPSTVPAGDTSAATSYWRSGIIVSFFLHVYYIA